MRVGCHAAAEEAVALSPSCERVATHVEHEDTACNGALVQGLDIDAEEAMAEVGGGGGG